MPTAATGASGAAWLAADDGPTGARALVPGPVPRARAQRRFLAGVARDELGAVVLDAPRAAWQRVRGTATLRVHGVRARVTRFG